jgi:peptidyl-prolyl cis-trans isomerase B (cyclophilin B)
MMAKVLLKTSEGDITLELNEEKAPVSTKNFLEYVDSGHYAGTIFHRVIEGFMVQGGGYDASFAKKPTQPPIQNEATNGLKNNRGTVAMARTSDVGSATAQFFINVVDNEFLNHKDTSQQGYGYCVFGEVTDGMDVVDKIRKAPTGSKGPFQKDCPLTDVVIESATRVD